MSDLLLRNVVLRTLRDQQRALVGFGIGLVGFSLMIGAIWPSVRDQTEGLQQLLDSYPPAMKAAFGIDTFDGPGFLKGEMFSFMVPLLFLIFAIGRGADLIAGEEERGALDVLLTQPIRRERVLLQKAAGLLLGLLILSAIFLVALAAVVTVGDFGVLLGNLAAAVLMLYLYAALFGVLAIAVGAVRARRGFVLGITAAIATATYLATVIARLVPDLEALQWASPFYYYSGADPLVHGLNVAHAAALLLSGAALLVLATWAFRRRDVGV